MRLGTLILMLSGLLLVACSHLAAEKTSAVTGAASSATQQSTASGERYTIKQQNSKIEFVASKVPASHHGEFQEFSGSIDYDGQPEKSRVSVTITMASVKTDTDQLTQQLKT